MLTRRTFLQSTAVAGAAVLSGLSRVQAAKYNLLIKGGRCLDPATRQVGVNDVGIAGGRITAVAPNLAAAECGVDD